MRKCKNCKYNWIGQSKWPCISCLENLADYLGGQNFYSRKRWKFWEEEMKKLATFLRNAKSFHHKIMMRYLRKRGWVVFYLEPKHRHCKGVCWLKLYESERVK